MDLIDRLKDSTPPFARRLSRKVKAALRNRRNNQLSPQEVFTRVYAEKMWGTGDGPFFSGPGSNVENAQPYAEFVRSWIARNNIRSVVDLGCGDFRVGGLIAGCGVSYTGVDVVPALIADNTQRFASETVGFRCLDITADDLPVADLCLIREVFQHISNRQIVAVLAKLGGYRYILFTDVQPDDASAYRVNADKVQGDSSRLVDGSCLHLEAPPFNVEGMQTVLEIEPPNFAGYAPYSSFKLRTFLWHGRPSQAGHTAAPALATPADGPTAATTPYTPRSAGSGANRLVMPSTVSAPPRYSRPLAGMIAAIAPKTFALVG